MAKYLRTEKIDVEKIVRELFNFSELGALSVQDVLTEEGRKELLEGILTAKDLFWRVPRDVGGKVIQEMDTVYIERVRDKIAQFPLFITRIDQLCAEYAEVYKKIADAAQFREKEFSSVGVHYYWTGSEGITPHQDYKADKNIIASFVIRGCAPFCVCADRHKRNSKQLDSSPGSIIFMRAARCEEEQPLRPFHYLVGPMTEDRYTILIRTRAKDKMDKLEYNQDAGS